MIYSSHVPRTVLAARVSSVFAVLACVLLASLLSLAPAMAAGPATVTVRVEGPTETLVFPTQVTTTTIAVVKDGNPADSCTGTSAAGALQLATGGNWNGNWFSGLGYSVETIEGQSFPFTQPFYWSFWLDSKPATTGICGAELSPGDSILFFPECFSETSGVCPPAPNPLGIEAPDVAEVGKPVTVTVTSHANATGTSSPAAGAALTGGGVNATTDSSGHATVVFSGAGTFSLRASAVDTVRTETTVCVHSGNDGACGTQTSSSSGGSAPGATTSGISAAPFKGPYALVPRVTGLVDGHVYTRAHAPRILSGSVLAHTTVSSVSLTLRREYRHRCYAFDGRSTRFIRARCGKGKPFNVSSNGTFSYLLPSALAPGRYVLDIQAADTAGNRTTLARGTSRVVFYVR
jgi:hypothetical protein